jgi:hypothetical protein
VSIELSLKLSLTISAARARGNLTVQIDTTTTRDKTMVIKALVMSVCEAKTRPRDLDIATSFSGKTSYLMSGLRRF